MNSNQLCTFNLLLTHNQMIISCLTCETLFGISKGSRLTLNNITLITIKNAQQTQKKSLKHKWYMYNNSILAFYYIDLILFLIAQLQYCWVFQMRVLWSRRQVSILMHQENHSESPCFHQLFKLMRLTLSFIFLLSYFSILSPIFTS